MTTDVDNSEQDIAKRAALEVVKVALTDFAVNFLRVMAGGGSPIKILRDMARCIAEFEAYRSITHVWPTSYELAGILDADKWDRERIDSWSDDERKRREENGMEDEIIAAMTIRQASLEIIAAQMAYQMTVRRNAETLFHEGLRSFAAAREARSSR